MSNINKMHHELELSVQGDRRRLESQVQLLESQTYVTSLLVINFSLGRLCSQDLKTQLGKEREHVRHVTLQKDLDTKELHARIDRAVMH
jgi:nucleoprotein TPR